jgi:peroxiredoxin Q/BCP
MTKNVKSSSKTPAGRKSKPGAKARSEGSSMEGKQAPAFTLPDQTGKEISLRELTARGNVVLYFYPKDLTPGCTTEACSFRDNVRALRALGAEIVGVSGDSTAMHQRFIDKYSLNFPLLSDVGNAVSKAYGVYKKKSLYGREYMGIERTTFIIGSDGAIRKAFPKVKVNGHTEEVIEALKELA